MFGRRRKQEVDNLGLSAPIVSPTASTAPAVSVSPTPAGASPVVLGDLTSPQQPQR